MQSVHRWTAILVLLLLTVGACTTMATKTPWPEFQWRLRMGPTTSQQVAILPDGVKVMPPGPDVPTELAQFSGTWTGWACRNRSCSTRIAVEQLTSKGGTIVFAVGSLWPRDGLGRQTGYARRAQAVYEDGELRTQLNDGLNLAFRMRSDGNLDMIFWYEGMGTERIRWRDESPSGLSWASGLLSKDQHKIPQQAAAALGMTNEPTVASPAVRNEDAEVVRWSRRGAEAGDGFAMAKLGWMYFTGKGGLVKDDVEAVRWFRKGAEAGDGFAMALLGSSYGVGLGGLPRDDSEAVRWFRKGAEAGDGRAMAMLGQGHLTGWGGLKKDEAEAIRWFRRGADAGDARAMTILGQMYLDPDGGLVKDDAEALRWLRKGAEAGDGFAMATLGSMYETAQGGLTKDDAEAVRWYRRGAEAGSGRAMAGLGSMYAHGRGGLPKDETEAVRWYRAGASLMDSSAMFELGQAYETGQGVTRDRREAARWYRGAASLGASEAPDRLRALGEEP